MLAAHKASNVIHSVVHANSTSVTVEKSKLDILLRENELFRAVLDNFPGGIALFDHNLRLVLCNKELRELLDYPDSLFEGETPTLEKIFRFNATRGEYGPGIIEELVAQKLKLVHLQRAHVYERTRPNGTILEVRGVPLSNGGFVTTYVDVTTQRRTLQAVQDNFKRDKLTNLPMRDYIEKQLWLSLQRLLLNEVVCLHCFDLDQFSLINHRHGRVVGDFVLKEISARLNATVRGYDFVARSGGDRFLILQTSVSRPSDVAKLAHRMLDQIKKPIVCGDKVVEVSASHGSALAPRDGRSVEGLIGKAEEIVLNSKKRNRNEKESVFIDW
jgi:diguanylate cyclase (GGDEF)-like protein